MPKRRKRGVPRKPPLSIPQLLTWADDFHDRTGKWPTRISGRIIGGLGLTWVAVDIAMRVGLRGLNPGSSVAKMLAKHRGQRHRLFTERLTPRRILAWADAHRQRTGQWPDRDSGPIVDAPGETWLQVDAALHRGGRGLPGGPSLAALLLRHRGRHSQAYRPRLCERQILEWADAYRVLFGSWPTKEAGAIGNTGETWLRVDAALLKGGRGLPGGSSLFRLLKQSGRLEAARRYTHRGKISMPP